MKRVLFFFGLFLLVAGGYTCKAQSVLDAEDDNNFTHFYSHTVTPGKKPMPYAYLRQDDVVWEHWVWRTIDFREKFNQFLYFPIYKVDEPNRDQQGRMSLTRVVMDAFESGAIEAYEDDDLLIPRDYETIMGQINRERTVHIAEWDEYGDETEGRDTIIVEEFHPENIYSCCIKEAWYIDKQDTRQKVRIVALSLIYNKCQDRGDELECFAIPLFWIPMNDMRVRNVFVTHNSYDERNSRSEMTYDDVFVTRYFDSFVTRETNTYNRSISSYLTGTDAILESQRVEDYLFNIESDMWEY